MERSYSELKKLKTFKERFDYLKLNGKVTQETFGFDRYLNQRFYHSAEWRHIRDKVIIRDSGGDLGLEDYPIHGRIYIHHMNPIKPEALKYKAEDILKPEFLVCVSFDTHQAIHYGDYSMLGESWTERTPNDTCPWKL